MALGRKGATRILLIAVGISLALYYLPAFAITGISVDTTTQAFTYRNWEGGGSESFGGELLDDTQYITSWMDNGDSEKVAAQARIRYLFPAGDLLRECRYAWYVNTGLGWEPMDPPYQAIGCGPNTLPNQWATLDAVTRVLHEPIVGGIAVEVQGNIGLLDPSWQRLARDEAYLLPGLGEIRFDRPTYEVGQTAAIKACVGYSGPSAAAWTVKLDGPETDQWEVPEAVCYPTPAAILYHTFSTPGQYRLTLLNSLMAVKDDDAAVVDDLDLAPSIQAVDIEPPGTRKVGDTLTVTITAAPNPSTGLPIEEYYFHVRQGPSTIIVDAWQASPTYTFTIQNDGDVQVNACVRDAERSACASRVDVQVEEPDNPWATFGVGAAGAPWWLWLAVGFLLAAALGVQFLPQVPAGGRNILSVLAMAAVVVLLMLYLVIPAVESWLRNIIPGA